MIQHKNTLKRFVVTILLVMSCAFLNAQDMVTIRIDTKQTYQTISNFGASDAWACQFTGNWPDSEKNNIADLLFSRDTLPDGSPKGIGLSLWRFNIGAGSVVQDNKSNINDEWRRTESFLNPDGSYDWTKQAGQVWFLKAAKLRGVEQFLGFANSPPISMTIDGRSNTTGGKPNIAAEKYRDFANYIANVTNGIYTLTGVKFDYVSPLNEPQWEWNSGQEGCPYTNAGMAALTRTIDSVFNERRLTTKIVGFEAGSLEYLVSPESKPDKGDQIDDFFKSLSPDYIGDLKHVDHVILAHDYFTTSPEASAIALREKVADKIHQLPGLGFWQSEYCILGDNSGEINGSGRDLGIGPALYLASVIHTTLTVANAASWQWWTAISPYNYKDGLIYIDKNKTGGRYYPSKMLWALGNYSRFIRPGAIRIGASVIAAPALDSPLLISAYNTGKSVVLVIVNRNNRSLQVRLTPGNRLHISRTYTTSQDNSLTPANAAGPNGAVAISAASVCTIICNQH